MDVLAIDDDIAEIDADPENEALGGRDARVLFGDIALNRDSAGDCFDNTRELDQQAVARGLHNTAFVLGNFGVN